MGKKYHVNFNGKDFVCTNLRGVLKQNHGKSTHRWLGSFRDNESDYIFETQPMSTALAQEELDTDGVGPEPVCDPDPYFEIAQELREVFPQRFQTTEQSLEVVEWIEERGLPGRRASICGELPEWMRAFVQILRYIKKHLTPLGFYAALRVWDEQVLDDINGNRCPSDFARFIGMTKAAVNKAEEDARLFFKRKPRRDQRADDSRAKMAASRMAQLGNNGDANHN
jgi:hypothetical protein